jgi:hypothetical protein
MPDLRRDDDRGSAMIIAITVVLITTTLSLGLLARALNGLSTSRHTQDFSGALASADAGLSDALFRVDQRGTGLAANFCVGTGCPVTSVTGSPGVVYKATAVDNNTYLVKAKGLVNGVPHGIEATLRRDLAFPFAIFGSSSLTFNGNSDDQIYTVDADGHQIAQPPADAGSNGTITCNGGSQHPANHHIVYPGGSTNCSFPINATGVYQPHDPVPSCPAPTNTTPATPCVPSPNNGCPVGGLFPPIVNPGVYYCTSTVTMPSTVTVGSGTTNGGVVEIYVIPSSGTADFNFDGSNGSDVNVGGDPTKFRVYMAGAGNVNPGNGGNAGKFTGIMYAPSSNMTSNGCKVEWRGALVFNNATCNGGPHLSVKYDVRVTSLVQANWSVHNYHEIPSNQVVVP